MQRQQFNRSSGVNEGDLRGDRVGGWRQNLLAGIGSPVNLQNDAGHLRHRGQPVQAPQAYNYNRPDLVQNQPFHNEYASKNYKAQQERLGLELRQVELEIRQTELHRQILQSQEMVEHGNGPFLQSMVSHLPVPSHSSEKIAPNGHTFPSNFGSGGLQVIATDHSYDKLQRQEDVARWMPSNLESPTSVKYNRGSSIAVRHDHIDPGQNLFRTASYRHFQYGTEKDLEHDAYDRSGPSRQEKTTRLQDFDDRGLVSQRGTESTYHASNHERKLTEQMHTQTAETLQTTVDPPIVFDAPANVLSTAAKTSSPTSTGSKWIVPYDVRKLPREPTLSSNPSVRQSPMFDQDSEEDDLALVHVTHDRINLPAESTSSQSDHRSLFRVLPGLERLFHQNGHRNTMPGPSHHKSEASFRANKTNFQPRHQESKARDFEDLESGQRERGNSLLTPANESTSVPSTATQRHKIHPLAVDPVLSILQPEPGPLHLYYDDARRHDSVQEEELRYKKPTVSDDNSRHDQLHTIQKPNDPAPQPQTRLVDENINNDQITTSLAVHSNQPSPIPPIELAKNNGGTLTGALHPQRSSKPTLIPVIEAAQQDVLLKAEQLTNVREPHRAIAESPSKNVDVIQVEEETCYCGAARPSEDECYFCWPCNGQVFCAGCWMMCPPHKKNSFPGRGMGLPHEKSDPATARKIYETLQSDQSADEQARLHKDDLDTSWFGTGRDEVTGEVVFQDFGRYPRLMQQSAGRYRRIRYPALVSFVGQTGAGKSSLIRLLIEIFTSAHAKPQVPVVGSTLLADLPTSGDVHLYSDPRTYDTEQPILFADCEGLNGGEREPMGARAKGKTKGSTDNHETTPSLTQILSPHHQTSEREISWADSPLRRSREYHVHHLYPRLLYTFSDVIVFVMKNPRVIENTIEQLVSWAAAALETSSNQPVLPHAVIVLNAYDNASDPNLWDVNESTVDLMERVSRAVHKNHNMRKFAEFWRERGKCIESVQMLLHSYYSSIRVVRVPERGRPKLINEQVTKLYDEIRDACESSLYSKHKLRMLLNADELQPYLQYAFDHFSRNLEHPFDFVQASLANNPMPSNFGGNILKLAIDIMDHWRDTLDGPSIFKELSFMVASCIMLDSARHRTLGPAERVLGAYVHFCNDALEVFCNRHWPCEYVHEDTQGRCVNVRAGHQSKGHQLSNGRVTGVGAYESDFTPEKYRDIFQYCVLRSLKDLLMRLGEDTKNDLRHELQKAGEIHCEKVLHHFYRHLHGATNFISHTACFCCLVAPPEHALPCGHVLCTPCVQAFGSARGQCYIEMSYCPLHKHDTDGSFPTGWLITVKPYGAGVRVACLDNGMIRTVAQLVLLQQLELHLGPGLPIQAFIDLFIREGSGGIIALALGVNGWSVEKTTRAYKDICARVFAKKRLLGIPGLEFLPISNHRRYDSKRLEAALMETFGNSQNLFAGSRDEICRHIVPQRRTKAAVIVTTALGKFELLGNYNRLEEEDDGDYHFRRSEKPKCEIKISQAARASFSMPQYFSPVTHDASGQVYQDASHYHSCPVEVAAREARLIWPDTARSGPDILLSIGTGIASGSSNLSRKPHRLGFSSREKQSSRAFMEALQTGQASEKRWNTFIDQKVPEGHQKSQYVRFNFECPISLPRWMTSQAWTILKVG